MWFKIYRLLYSIAEVACFFYHNRLIKNFLDARSLFVILAKTAIYHTTKFLRVGRGYRIVFPSYYFQY